MNMEFLKEYVALTVFILLGLIQHTHTACLETVANNCVITFIDRSGVSTDIRGFPIPFKDPIGPSDFLTLCQAKDEYKRCINGFKNDCDTTTRLFYEGYATMFDYLCSQGNTKYQNNGPCLGSPSNKAFGDMCLNVRDNGLTFQNWCSKQKQYFGCLTKGALTYCDRTMANYQFDVVSSRYAAEAAATFQCAVETGPYDCVDNGVTVCLDIFLQTSNLYKDFMDIPLPFSTNTQQQDYDKVCQSYNVLKTCTSYDAQCQNQTVQGTLDGVIEAFGHICGSGRFEYATHNPCLGTPANIQATVECLQTYYNGLDSNNWCSKTTELLACQHNRGAQLCGEAAADYQEDIQRRLLIKLGENHSCPVHAGTVQASNGGSLRRVGSASVILTTILITLGLMMQ